MCGPGGAAHSTLVGLKLQAGSSDDETRNALDVVVCLDISGSMAGKKLQLCKATITLLLRELRDVDSFALVTFSDKVTTPIPAMKCTEANKKTALAKLEMVKDEGTTNLSGGLQGRTRVIVESLTVPVRFDTIS